MIDKKILLKAKSRHLARILRLEREKSKGIVSNWHKIIFIKSVKSDINDKLAE